MSTQEICDCAFGLTGFQGKDGVSGKDGDRGYQGYQGFQGVLGMIGAAGYQGLGGQDGQNGRCGPMGYPGRDGGVGQGGLAGSIGGYGPPGPPGIPGQDGAPGQIGPRGYEGAVGQRGPAGVAGLRGDRGFQGFIGSQGNDGAQGSSAGFNLVMESARTQSGIASSVVSLTDGDTIRLWSSGGIALSLASGSAGSALYNIEPNNMQSAVNSPSLAPSDPFRPSLYIDTSTSSVWMWDPNSGGGSWKQQTGKGSPGFYGGSFLTKISNVIPQVISSAVLINLTGSIVNINLTRSSLVRVDVFMNVSGTLPYTLTGNIFQNGLAFDGDPDFVRTSSVSGATTNTIQHSNSRILGVGAYEIKYQLRVGIGESITVDQHYIKISIISA